MLVTKNAISSQTYAPLVNLRRAFVALARINDMRLLEHLNFQYKDVQCLNFRRST